MKVVVCNKYFFETGGPERYMFGLIDLLQHSGHEAIPFSVQATRNAPSPYADYFVRPPVDLSLYGCKLAEQKLHPASRLRLAVNAVSFRDARRQLERLIDDSHPDLVYALNFTSYLSPSILLAARSRGLPIVVRLSSFDLLCANNLFLRGDRACTLCLNGKYHGIAHKCVGNSYAASAAKVVAMYIHGIQGVYRHVDRFVAPSKFMRQMMVRAGYAAERFEHIPTFVDTSRFRPLPADDCPGDYVLYFGRIAAEKDIGVIINAHAKLGHGAPRLVIMGKADAAEDSKLRRLCERLHVNNVEFVGPKTGDALVSIVQHARFVVSPSVCFENTPNAIYEAFACARAVLAADIGSIPEQVIHGHNGLLFPPSDADVLASHMRLLLTYPGYAQQLGANALHDIGDRYTGATHLNSLMRVFEELVSRQRVRGR